MTRRTEVILLVLCDFFALNGAWYAFFWLRVESGWFVFHRAPALDTSYALLPITSIEIYLFWMVLFLFFGLYRPWYVRPIFDELVTLVKTLSAGAILLSLLIWWDSIDQTTAAANDPRILGFTYWSVAVLFCCTLRLLVRYSQRRLLSAGIGTRLSIIVGDFAQAKELAERVSKYPQFGYNVIGFVSPELVATTGSTEDAFQIAHRNGKGTTTKEFRRLGTTANLETVIEESGAKEVLIALGSNEHDKLIDVISRASRSNVGMKIVPDLYDIVSGQARTREIYGFPLIDVNPILMRPWEQAAKRMLDIIASFTLIILGSPVWLLTAIGVKVTSKGPLIYSQERIGKEGKPFRIYKFRSMQHNAEREGPQWASKNDPRVTPFGRFLRKSHLDEVPQMWNVLKGDMSLVGPRPERPYFVKQLVKEIPYYDRRHKVRPGVTGLYQTVIDKYDENLDDVRKKVKYDLMYIESMSFRLDLKILLHTAYIMLRGRGQA
jgi:exopolysaccharide biosynthesis polyprenyl glycosylphosphotransferase